jgi:MinD-like ATPase involved in chromosome partitioning or flagellar assembly
MGEVIGIMSGKGGVGKTTIALNLALAMQRLGEDAIVVDGDIKNPNIGLYLGIYRYPATINDVLKGNAELNDAKCKHYTGISIIPASLSFTSPEVGLSKLKNIFSEMSGHVLLDFAPGLGRDALSLLELCDKSLIVTNPNIPSVASTLRLANIIESQNKHILGVVINMTGRSYEISREAIETICPGKAIWEIPEDENVRKSAMMKTPLLDYRPYSRASIKFMEVAANLTGQGYEEPGFSRLRDILSIFRKRPISKEFPELKDEEDRRGDDQNP